MSSPDKEVASKSEVARSKLATSMTESGMSIQGRNIAAGMQDSKYKARGRASSRANASNAIAMKQNAERGRVSNRVNVAKNSLVDVVGSGINLATIKNRVGVSRTQRIAQSASHAVKYGSDSLRTMAASSSIANSRQRLSVRSSNRRRQSLLDGIAAVAGYGLEKKFKKDKADKLRQKAFDADMATGQQYDTPIYSTDSDMGTLS